jgi:hypothetical protein
LGGSLESGFIIFTNKQKKKLKRKKNGVGCASIKQIIINEKGKLTSALKQTIEFGLVEELGMLGLEGLEFDGYLFPSGDVNTFRDQRNKKKSDQSDEFSFRMNVRVVNEKNENENPSKKQNTTKN